MIHEVGAFEAKTHLSELLEKVRQGDRVVITRRGVPVAVLGMFDQAIGWGHAGKAAWMFVGGMFIGFGTRLGGGCTSGHGIFGISNLELPSFITTMSFMAGGVLTTHALYWIVLHR